MKRAVGERSPLYPKILFSFTDHPITVWAGVILLRIYFEWIGLEGEGVEGRFGGICEAVEQSDHGGGGDVELVLRFSVGSRAV